MWFDVVFQYYTTEAGLLRIRRSLWFDVVFQYYTTKSNILTAAKKLWFDVVFQYYTTDIYKAIRKATGLPPGMGHKYYEEWRVMTPAEKASKKRARPRREVAPILRKD